jgi:CRISPR/Cas system-associated exonuclease Cas4 (RecB family)
MSRHYSCSQRNMYLRCPRQYRYRYIDGIVAPPGAALIVGSATHVTAGEAYARGKALDAWTPDAARTLMSGEEAEDLTAAEFDKRATDVPWETEDEEPGVAKDRAICMARHVVKDVVPASGRPVSVEERIEVQPQGEDWTFVAIPDVVVVNGELTIRDLKTKGKAPSGVSSGAVQADTDHAVQLAAYRYAYRALGRGEPSRFAVDYVWTTKKNGAQHAAADVAVTDADLVLLFDDLRDIHAAIKAGVFPRNRGSWACNPRWCGYFDRCIASAGRDL